MNLQLRAARLNSRRREVQTIVRTFLTRPYNKCNRFNFTTKCFVASACLQVRNLTWKFYAKIATTGFIPRVSRERPRGIDDAIIYARVLFVFRVVWSVTTRISGSQPFNRSIHTPARRDYNGTLLNMCTLGFYCV